MSTFDHPAAPTAPEIVDRPQWRLALATAVLFASSAAWVMAAPMVAGLEDEWGLSSFEVALLVASPIAVGAAVRLRLGMAAGRIALGRIDPESALAILLGIGAVAAMAVAFAESFAMMLPACLLLGVAGGSVSVCVPYVLA
ncbi:MAG TPA: hypothetical protein VFD37_06725, partial [Solirubrobacterales bacterium]|nr:hypothetical protein [Solirubrobacterales bacterium]